MSRLYRVASGMGAYSHVGDWSWEFYPPPYDFLAPSNSAPQPAPVLYPPPARPAGLGCGCGCGGGCASKGMGLFDSMDMSTWGWGEWGAIAVGVYLLVNVVGDVKVAGKKLRSAKSRVRARREAETGLFG